MGRLSHFLWDKEIFEVPIGIFVILLFLVLNLVFWFNGGLENTTFDNHGLKPSILLYSLLLLEIIFFLFLAIKEKPYWTGWLGWSLLLKAKAFFYTSLIYVVIAPLVWLLSLTVRQIGIRWGEIKGELFGILIVWGIIGAIILFFFLNYLLAKLVGKEKKRLFKDGEKVMIRKDLEVGKKYGTKTNYHNPKLRGKKVIIKGYYEDEIEIKGDDGSWSEEMFEKLKEKKK